jgi:hypothetical protein
MEDCHCKTGLIGRGNLQAARQDRFTEFFLRDKKIAALRSQ